MPLAQQQPWLRAVVSNWELSGVTTFSGGTPFTPTYSLTDSVDIIGTPSEIARIVALGDNQFGRPAPRTFGNAGVNILRGPGINNWDLRVGRRFALGSERKVLEFRAEFYNLPNHPQFSNVDQTARFNPAGEQINPLFLTPTSSRPPRRIQFALKLNW